MNNLKQKNVIYGRDIKDVLPHSGEGESVTLKQNTNITDLRINNAFQQLVNNDLYLENRLIAGLEYQPGPEKTQAESAISALPDGSKRWVQSDDYTKPLQIYKKIETPLSQSVGLVRAGNVVFVAPIGDAVFVAFADRLMYDLGAGFVDCTDQAGAAVAATGYCDSASGAFFVSDTSVYGLVQSIGSSGGTVYKLQRLNANSMSGLKCVQYDAAGGMLYVGGSGGFIARGRYVVQSQTVQFAQDMKFCADDVYGSASDTNRYVSDITVNAIEALDRKDYSVNSGARQTNILAATSGGMFRSDTKFFLDVETEASLAGKTCVDVVQHGGVIYVLDADGCVYRQTGQGFQKYPRVMRIGSPKGLASHSSGLYAVGAAGVYRYFQMGDSPDVQLEFPLSDASAMAVATLFDERVVFVAAPGESAQNGSIYCRVYYYSTPGKVGNIVFEGCASIKQIVAQPRKGERGVVDVYVIGSDGAGTERLFAAYIGFSSQKVVDVNRIDDISCAVSGIDAAARGGSCYYFRDGTIYNRATGQQKRLGDVRVRQMEYLPDDNTIALATNIGFIVLNAQTFDVVCRDSDETDVLFASQYGKTACFASSKNVYAAHRDGASIDVKPAGGVGSGFEIGGVATDGQKVYAISKASGAGTGAILAASLYYARTVANGDAGCGDAVMAFPVMPFMAETGDKTALGISSGQAYRLTYDGSSPSYEAVTFPETDGIDAFCMAGSHVFVAAGGNIHQYECSADVFDPGDVDNLIKVSQTPMADVSRMVYSGKDSTFDMRIYAQSGENSLYVYQPGFANIEKYTPTVRFMDFVMYVDDLDEAEDGEDETRYVVMVGISESDANLHVVSALVGDAAAVWEGSEVSHALPPVDAEYDGTPQSDRTPYALFYADNTRVYVAYTAKIREDLYSDYILALDTTSLLSGGIGDTLDFARLGSYGSLDQAGVSKFTGFNVPGSDEDIDVIATCYFNDPFGYALATFKVNANTEGQRISGVHGCTYFQPDPAYRCFQPDCVQYGSGYYIVVPAITPDGDTLRAYVFRYLVSSNSCSLYGYADVAGVGSVAVSNVYVPELVRASIAAPRLAVVLSDGRAFSVEAAVGKTVQWAANAKPVLGGKQFLRVVRCGMNQIVGFDNARSLVYDFQTGAKWEQTPGSIFNVYATDSEASRNYMLIQGVSNKIYSVEPSTELAFTPVGHGIPADGRKTILKVNNVVFVVVWGAEKKIYQENAGGGFTQIAAGTPAEPSGDGYKDVQISYGFAQEYSSGHGDADEYIDGREYYVFFLRQSGSIDMYAMVGESYPRSLQKVCEFESSGYNAANPDTYSYFSYISYAGNGSDFDRYTRTQAFNGVDHYDWPILITPESDKTYMYLDFQDTPGINCGPLETLFGGAGHVGVGKSGETVYRVKVEGGRAVAYSMAGAELARCDVDSSYAWLVDGKWVFQKTGGGIRYYDGESWRDAGSGQYELADKVQNGLYYFIKAEGARKDLYESVSIATYPVKTGPAASTVVYVGQAGETTPVRLASGRTYAGLVCQNSLGVRSLCILWPTDGYIPSPADDEDVEWPDVAEGFAVYVCPAAFSEFPDGRVNTMEIVPVGNFLDEIIVYEGGYLHIAKVSDHRLITDYYGSSVIPVTGTMPWTELGMSFAAGICASAKVGGRRYVTAGSGLSSFTEGSSGLSMKILSPLMKADSVDARQFYQTGQNAFLIATDKGVYKYQHVEGLPVIRRLSPGSGYDAAQITSYNFTGIADTYVIANKLDGYIYSSENCRVWKKEFCPVPSSPQLRAVYPRNAREWYFGTQSGLYKSSYKYTEVDDLVKFTEDDLYSLYAEMLSTDISSRCDDEIGRHESDKSYALGHLSSSFMYNANTNLLSVNFEGLQSSGWQKHVNTYSAAEYSVSNDIVFEQFWGSNADWDVILSVENQFVTTANAKFTYMLRRWMSGITEVYVHIPTTNTYYVNHLPSTPDYHVDEDASELSAANVTQFGRNKTKFKHDPNEPGVYTTVKLALSRYTFFVDQVLEVQACGNSLPLKIYKETIRENGSDADYAAAQYFNSYVAPTVLMSTVQGEDDYIFNFACFGADEQVVKIQFIDTVNRFDQEYCRLVFDSNGLDSDQGSFVKQRIRLDGRPYALRRNQYQWPQDQRLFAGWTFTPYPPVNKDTTELNGFYVDKQQITSSEICERCGTIRSGQDVKLYAVWITYQFGASDTTLLMSPQQGRAAFTLGSAETTGESRLGSKIIVKYEEVN